MVQVATYGATSGACGAATSRRQDHVRANAFGEYRCASKYLKICIKSLSTAVIHSCAVNATRVRRCESPTQRQDHRKRGINSRYAAVVVLDLSRVFFIDLKPIANNINDSGPACGQKSRQRPEEKHTY